MKLHQIFWIHPLTVHQKIGHDFSNKGVQKVIKTRFSKKCAPKLVFFIEKKKFRKIGMIFDIENSLWKSDFDTFWQPVHTVSFDWFLSS